MTDPAETTIFTARTIRTLDRGWPEADAIAVRGGRIVAVGPLEDLRRLGPARIDERFAEQVIVPGFVEAHTHTFTATLWDAVYTGFFARRDPDGRTWPGCRSVDEIVATLAQAAPEATTESVLGWGFDATHLGRPLLAADLDRVSDTRPVVVLHASGHACSVNSVVLERGNVADHTSVQGVSVDADGRPDGLLAEPAAMAMAAGLSELFVAGSLDRVLERFAAVAADAGCTTVTDLGTPALRDPSAVDVYDTTTGRDDFPVRVSAFLMAGGPSAGSLDDEVALVGTLRARSSDTLQLGHVKLVLDGSIQQRTARVGWPGYLGSDARGIWVVPPPTYAELFGAFHAAGATVHVHCNGDEASELFLDVLAGALEAHPRWDHRHTITHSQLTTAAQYRRLAVLGGAANIFSNHIFYWGDQHRDVLLGTDRAGRMNAAATALACGVPVALHCDSPVTPIAPLATMHHAMNRRTASGELLGPDERIGVEDALRAMTLGPAWMLKLDHVIGSLEAGKFADMAVLNTDPYAVAPDEIASIGVVATVRGGVVRAVSAAP